jgi:hypothetical protein
LQQMNAKEAKLADVSFENKCVAIQDDKACYVMWITSANCDPQSAWQYVLTSPEGVTARYIPADKYHTMKPYGVGESLR